MYAFIFAVVQCGKGDAETILIVVQADVRSVGEVLVYTFAEKFLSGEYRDSEQRNSASLRRETYIRQIREKSEKGAYYDVSYPGKSKRNRRIR